MLGKKRKNPFYFGGLEYMYLKETEKMKIHFNMNLERKNEKEKISYFHAPRRINISPIERAAGESHWRN